MTLVQQQDAPEARHGHISNKFPFCLSHLGYSCLCPACLLSSPHKQHLSVTRGRACLSLDLQGRDAYHTLENEHALGPKDAVLGGLNSSGL